MEQHYAGFWIRLAAMLIDMVILIVVTVIPLIFIYGEEYLMAESIVFGIWDVLLNYVLPFVATIWFWVRFMGTPGKMVLKLQVVDKDTEQALSVGQAIGRYIAYILSTIPFCLGFLWVAFDKNKQGWHDKLAKTVVIRVTDTKN